MFDQRDLGARLPSELSQSALANAPGEGPVTLATLADHLIGHAQEVVRQIAEIDRRVFGAQALGEAGTKGLNHADPTMHPVFPVRPSLQNALDLLVEANTRAAKLLAQL